MWKEPLAPSAEPVASHTVAITVHDAAGLPVASVLCLHNADAGFGVFGEMQVLDDGGGPRQTARALVLLVREALRFANTLGVTRVRTEAPERIAWFAARLAGTPGVPLGRTRRLFEGELQAVRTAALAASGDDGTLRGVTRAEEDALHATIRVRR